MAKDKKRLQAENDFLRAMCIVTTLDLQHLKGVVKKNVGAICQETPWWKLRAVRKELKQALRTV